MAEVSLNLPTNPFLFVLSDIFPAARAIKPHLHATSGFVWNRSIALTLELYFLAACANHQVKFLLHVHFKLTLISEGGLCVRALRVAQL